MKICGNDGQEFRCCKTGLVIHDANFHPDSRHAADLFFCPTCKTLFIQRNDNDYFCTDEPVHLTITHDLDEPMLWDVTFVNKIMEQYKLDLLAPSKSTIVEALIDLTDSNNEWDEHQRNTGLPEERCKEIEHLICNLLRP